MILVCDDYLVGVYKQGFLLLSLHIYWIIFFYKGKPSLLCSSLSFKNYHFELRF
jgi:hypothetical protein